MILIVLIVVLHSVFVGFAISYIWFSVLIVLNGGFGLGGCFVLTGVF